MTTGQGEFTLNADTRLTVNDGGAFTQEVFALQEGLRALTGSYLSTGADGDLTINKVEMQPTDAYRLKVTPTQVVLEAGTPTGAYYGVQTLLQWAQGGMKCVEIQDYPAYPWRGLMLDVSRHFYPLEYLKQQVRLLARYKMNKLHIHLTDDEGWRLEIKSMPELTQKSAWRDMDRHDKQVLEHSQKDSRVALDPRFLQETDGRMRYGGYYTQDEMRDLVQYAAQHHVDIVPEIDMPGHMMAAIQVYPELCSTGKPSWGDVFSQPLCPANEAVFTFVQKVWDEVLSIFPSEVIHIGADEVDKTTWKESAACQELMRANQLKDEHALQTWFVERVSQYLKSQGREVVVWDDAIEGDIAKDTKVMYWRDWKAHIPYESTERGYPTIFCPGTPMYLSRQDSALYDIYHLRSLQELTVKHKDLIQGVQANVWAEGIGNSDWANHLIYPRLLAVAEIGWTPYEQRDWENFKRRAEMERKYLAGQGIDLSAESPFLTVTQKPDATGKGVRFHFDTEKIEPKLVYTLDGQEPTAGSKSFTDNLLVKGPSVLKVGIVEGGQALQPVFSRPVDYHKAVGKPVTYHTQWTQNYPAAAEATLTDGLQGADYYKDTHWQGFTEDIEVVIDLQDLKGLKDFSMRFMQISEEEVYIPSYVEVSFSEDGNTFKVFKRLENDVDSTLKGLVWKTFQTSLKGAKGRYMKVLCKNGHDQKFIFADEVVIH